MSSKVLSLIRQLKEVSNDVIGYTEHELKKIEALYEISIQGQLREFMLLAGRCDGGLIGDDPIILYRPTWNVSSQILFQLRLWENLQEIQAYDFMGKYESHTFCFSCEWETQYYFTITSNTDDLVYHYDENSETVECTNLTFYEYLDDVYKRYVEEDSNRKQIVCKGELLEIRV